VADRELDWFVLRGGYYLTIDPGPDGITRSEVFPGLWLDAPALLRGDTARVLTASQTGPQQPGTHGVHHGLAGTFAGAGVMGWERIRHPNR